MSDHSHQKNWFQRHWKWLIPLLIVVLMILVFVTPIGTVLKDYGSLYTNPPLYEDALLQVKNHNEASGFLGTPITTGLLFEGEVQYADDGNSVNMTIPIKGSKTNAKMDVKAVKISDTWDYKHIRVRHKKTKTIIEVLASE